MHFLKVHYWKLMLLGGAIAVASWLGWGYANQSQPTLMALNTTTGTLQWVYPLSSDFGYSKGPTAGNGKVVLDGCLRTADNNCGAYQIQAFDAQSGKLLWSDQPSGNYSQYSIASNQSAFIQANRLYLQLENELLAVDLVMGVKQWTIPRRWFYHPSVWYGMGLVGHPDLLAILKIDPRTSLLQTLDPKTGKLQQQADITLPKLATTNNIIATNDRTLFLEAAGLERADTSDSFYDSGTATVIAYDSKTLQLRFRTDIKSGGIFQMEAIGNILLLDNFSFNDVKTQKISEGTLLAMDANTGKVLWQKTFSQIDCYRKSFTKYQVDADTVYLECQRMRKQDSRIVALSIQTGAVKWQTELSTDLSISNLPAALNDQHYLTFRKVEKTDSQQIQAVALDPQTGKLLWAFPLFADEDRYVGTFSIAIVAVEGNRFFTLDRLPRWQLWLLQMNPNWYVNNLRHKAGGLQVNHDEHNPPQ
jgi:outer membrane protein assembly factor BamB